MCINLARSLLMAPIDSINMCGECEALDRIPLSFYDPEITVSPSPLVGYKNRPWLFYRLISPPIEPLL